MTVPALRPHNPPPSQVAFGAWRKPIVVPPELQATQARYQALFQQKKVDELDVVDAVVTRAEHDDSTPTASLLKRPEVAQDIMRVAALAKLLNSRDWFTSPIAKATSAAKKIVETISPGFPNLNNSLTAQLSHLRAERPLVAHNAIQKGYGLIQISKLLGGMTEDAYQQLRVVVLRFQPPGTTSLKGLDNTFYDS